MTLLPLTKSFAGQVDLDALREPINWLRDGVLVDQHPARAWEYGMAVDALAKWNAEADVRYPALILDVGGTGSRFGRMLEDRMGPGWDVELVDPKETGRLEDRQDGAAPPAQVILAISTIEHVPDQEAFLLAIAANLVPGGLAFLTMDGKGDEGPDVQHFHWMRERIYTPGLWIMLAASAAAKGLILWGGVDWAYHSDQLYDYSFFSLCLRKS